MVMLPSSGSLPFESEEQAGGGTYCDDASVHLQVNSTHSRSPVVVRETQYTTDVCSESPGGLPFDPLRARTSHAQILWQKRATDAALFAAYPDLRTLDWRVEDAIGAAAWWGVCNLLFERSRRGAQRLPTDVGRAFAVPYVIAPDTDAGVLTSFEPGAPGAAGAEIPTTDVYCCVICLGKCQSLDNVAVFNCRRGFYLMKRHVADQHQKYYDGYKDLSDSAWKRAKEKSVPHPKSKAEERTRAIVDAVAELPLLDVAVMTKSHRLIVSWVLSMGLPRARCYDGIWTAFAALLTQRRLPVMSKSKADNIVSELEADIVQYTRQVLQDAENISLLYDLWATHGATQTFALIACCLDKQGNMRRCVVDVSECRTLTSTEMKMFVERAVERYPELKVKLLGVVCDAGRNTIATRRDILHDHMHGATFAGTCVSHVVCTILKHVWSNVAGLLLYPPAESRFGQSYDPSRTKVGGRTDHDTSRQWGGDKGIYTLDELFKLIPTVQNHLRKSSIAQTAFEEVVWLLRESGFEAGAEFEGEEFVNNYKEFIVPVEGLGDFRVIIAPTRFAYRYIFLCEVCKCEERLLAAFEATDDAAKKWPMRARVTKDAFTVFRALAELMKPLSELALDGQDATGAFTASDVAKRLWLTYVASKEQLKIAQAEVERLENESVEATLVDTTVARLQVAYHTAQLMELESSDCEFAGYLKWLREAIHTPRRDSGRIKCDETASLFITALFLNPHIWTDAELTAALEGCQPTDSPAVGVAGRMEEFLAKMTKIVTNMYDKLFPVSSLNFTEDSVGRQRITELFADVLHEEMQNFHAKHALFAEIHEYALFALSDAEEKMRMSTMYTNVSASKTQCTLSQFWCTSPKVQAFPLLAKLARKIMSIPMTQIDCERLFSFFGDLTSGKRNRTSTEWLYKSAIARFNCPWEELLKDVLPHTRRAPIDSGTLHVDAERIARAQRARATSLDVRRDLADSLNAVADGERGAPLASAQRADDSVPTGEHAPADSGDVFAPAVAVDDVTSTGAALEAAAMSGEEELTSPSPPPVGGARRKSALEVPGSARKGGSESPAGVRRSKRATAGQRTAP